VVDSFFDQLVRLRRIGRRILRSSSRGWAFFKDIHFGWYVLVPIISSSSAFGDAAAFLAWSIVISLLLAIVAVAALDSLIRPGDSREHSQSLAGVVIHPLPQSPRLPGTIRVPRTMLTSG
jgi:hypothetical protein